MFFHDILNLEIFQHVEGEEFYHEAFVLSKAEEALRER